MFNLNNDFIKEECSLPIYNKGLTYLKEERITSVKFSHHSMTVLAKVAGTELYNTVTKFDKYGNLTTYRCDCLSYASYAEPCKHIAALMLYIYFQDSRGLFDDAINRKYSDEIFNIFEEYERLSSPKTPLVLEPTLEVTNTSYRKYEYQLSLKIGIKKLYVVKNIRTLIHNLNEGKSIYFGQQFTLDPTLHYFDTEAKKLLDMLKHVYDTVALLSPYSMDYYSSRLFPGKYATLSESFVNNFFKSYKQHFNLIVDDYTCLTRVTDDTWSLPLSLNEKADDLILRLNLSNDFVRLDNDFNFILWNDLIYDLTKPSNSKIKPFLLAYETHDSNEFYFSGHTNNQFISKILPYAELTGSLTIDNSLSEKLVKLPLTTEIYLDKQNSLYTAEVKFNYGENVINPYELHFSNKAQSIRGLNSTPDKQNALTHTTNKNGAKQSEGFVIRDVEKERVILDILKTSGLSQVDGKLCTKNDNTLYKFITETIPDLQKHASLYYSEAFKNVKIRSSLNFSGNIRLNQETNLLEFDFSADEISTDELKDLIASIRVKKRYFKLKNGSFLNMESDDIVAISHLLDSLDLSGKDFDKGIAVLPTHRAMYIETTLNQFKDIKMQRNESFEKLVNDISNPEIVEYLLPDELGSILRQYQVFGYKWLRTLSYYGFGGILADDMGLGKTLQILTFLLSYKKAFGNVNALIIVPTSLVFNWQAEIEKFTPSLTNIIVAGNKCDREDILSDCSNYNIVITSYPLIRRDVDTYKKMRFDFCILDEAQHIKNPGSQNSKCVKSINAKHRFALTGTPMENNLSELWSIFDFIMPGYLFSHNKFSQRFEMPILKQQSLEASKNLSRHINPFILRRLKRDVLKELPEKIENKMISELAPEQKKVYLAYLSKAKGEITSEISDKGYEKSQIKILAALTRLRQICCHPSLFIDNYKHSSGKLLQLEEIIQDAIEGSHRILLFSQFTSMLRIISKSLDAMNFEYFYLDGSTPMLERGEMVNRFNNGERQLFLISLKAGGTGLNLTGADMVIHYDPWWNPAVEDQATDRAYRIGQEKRVQVIKLITKGTIEEKIFNLQQKKKALIDNVIQPGETLISKMSKEDIEALFD